MNRKYIVAITIGLVLGFTIGLWFRTTAPNNHLARTVVKNPLPASNKYATWTPRQFHQHAQWLIKTHLSTTTKITHTQTDEFFRSWAQADPDPALTFAMAALPPSAAPVIRRIILSVLVDQDTDNLIQAIDNTKHVATRYDLEKALLQVLQENNPAAALEFALNRNLLHSDQTIREIVGAWALQNPTAAADAINILPLEQHRQWATQAIAAAWTYLDASAAWAWIESIAHSNLRREAIRAYLAQLAIQDGAIAADLALQLEGRRKGDYLHWAVVNWAQQAPNKTLAWTGRLEDVRLRNWLYVLICERLIEKDPLLVASVIAIMNASAARSHLLSELLDSWMRYDPDSAMQWVENLSPGKMRDTALNLAIHLLDQVAPEKTLPYLEVLPSGPTKNSVIRQIAINMAKENPAAALHWVQGQDMSMARAIAEKEIVSTWAELEPLAAMRAIDGLDGTFRRELIGIISASWAGKNPQQSLEWIDQELTEADRVQGLSYAIMAAAAEDYPLAAEYLNKLLVESNGTPNIDYLPGSMHPTESASIQVAGNWQENNIKKGIEWAAALPESAAKDRALWSLINRWAETEPGAAAEYVTGMPQGQLRDEASMSIASEMATSNPAKAFEWAASIQDPQRRRVSAEAIYDRIYEQDSDAAKHGLISSGFTEQEVADILGYDR